MDMENAFRSARLVYRAVEDNDADKNFIREQINSDPITLALSAGNLLRPQSEKDAAVGHGFFAKNMLSVFICLPADKSTSTSDSPAIITTEEEQSTSTSKTSESKPKKATRAEQEPTPIGFAFLTGSGQLTAHNRNSTLGISLAKQYQEKGYGTEALNWVLDWAFIHGDLHSVSLQCFSYNDRGLYVYEKVGFVREGRLREVQRFQRRWYDVLLFSILESEWAARRAEMENVPQLL
jgi:RimJ/RimL family protein N-acetyltransferase